ncbi:glutamate-rich protein 6 [Antechinus flavipes]|uniref:glutamate-rich protein 6 n=1 Tax=Antechinus flavipes TaxID=38775 RepID=UPI0022363409|nr:glutamate-rich protein 6 [Antechinus flavipes]
MASSGHDRSPSRQEDAQQSSAGSSKSSVVSGSSSSQSTTDASSQTSEEEFYTQRSSSISKILDLFKKESTSSFQDLIREEPVTTAPKKGIDVAIQTEKSYLQSQYNKSVAVEDPTQPKKKTRFKNLKSALQKIATVRAYDTYSHAETSRKSYCPLIRAQWTVPERLQKLDILCKMEFKEDFEMFFEPLLKTIPRLGPPAILAYKPELPPHDTIAKYWEKDYPASCEYCGKEMKPFPSLEDDDFNSEDSENLFCCPEFRKLFEYVHREKKLIKNMYPVSESLSIEPHPPFGSEKEKRKAKEKAIQRIQERQMARTFVFMANEQEEVNVKQSRTVTYQLARHPSIKVLSDKALGDFVEDQYAFSIDSGDIWTLPCLKKIENDFLEKYYKEGGKFLTMFPDGTAQIFYPSGNLAAIVMSNRLKGLICVIQEDTANKPAIRAIFDSGGKVTCYYPNGNIWVNINLLGGQFADQEGNRVRIWKWSSTMTSLPLVSFKPIFLSLNNYVGVRILDQDKIIISFLALGQQARMNVGIKLQIRIYEEMPKLRYFIDEDLFLLALIIKIRRLLSKIEICVNFPSIENWHKLKTPSYLATRAIKLLSLCQYYELGKDAISRITTLLNEPI